MAAAGFAFGLILVVLGTLVESQRLGDLSPGGWWLAQSSSPLLWIIDFSPFVIAAAGSFAAAPPRSKRDPKGARQLSILVTVLVLVPMALLVCAQQQANASERMLAQINLAGYLRTRALWIYHAQQSRQGDWRTSLGTMQADLATLRVDHPAAVDSLQSTWKKFQGDALRNRVSWQSAEEMRRAAHILTNEIQEHADARSAAISNLLLLGVLSLLMGLIKCFDIIRQLRLAENELFESEGRLQRLSEASFEGVIIAENGVIILTNQRMSEIFGYSPQELIGMAVLKLIHPDSCDDVRRAYTSQSETPYCGKGLRKNGTIFEWESEGKATQYHGREVRVTAVRDITDRLRIEEKLRETSQLQAAIFDAAAHAIVATHADGKIQSFNPAAERLLGWSAQDVVGKKTPSIWHDTDEMAAYAREVSQAIGEEVSPHEVLTIRPSRGEPEEHEWTYLRKNGEAIAVSLTMTALRDEQNQVTGFLGVSYDITERKKQQAQIDIQRDELHAANARLHALATTDALTEMLNRRAFDEKLEAELQRSARTGEAFSLVLLDVDLFKQYNDSFGHLAGDDVLIRVAQILRETCRPIDIVARYGGEEFALIFPATLHEGALAAAERCRIAIEKSHWAQRAVTASFGVATWNPRAFPSHASLLTRATHIIRSADAALYHAKNKGRNRVSCLEQTPTQADFDLTQEGNFTSAHKP